MGPIPPLSLIVFFVFFLGSTSATLPSYIKACSRSDQGRKECMLKHGNEALPYILKGDRSIKLQSLLPVRFDTIDVNVGNLDMTLKDVDIFGLETAKLVDIDIDLERQMWILEGTLERVTLLGSYMVDGQILVLPIKGNGPFNITIDSVNLKYTLFFKIVIKHGKEFTIIDDNDKLDWKFEKVHFQFDNLFGGNRAMGDNVNKFLNENYADVMKELEGPVADVIKSILHRVCYSVLENVTLEELMLA